MCGRFVSKSSPQMLVDRFNVTSNDVVDWTPSYNVAPTDAVLIVRERDDERHLSRVRWGLVPSWAKDPKIGNRQINARAEGIVDKPAYRHAFATKRCLVPADGFYEWKVIGPPTTPKGRPKKQPIYIHARDDEPLALAGLWEVWKVPEGEHFGGADDGWLRTCTIITTEPNQLLAPIHDRMPVVLPETTWDAWLDPTNQDFDRLEHLLVAAPSETLEFWPVGAAVNSPETNAPGLIRAIQTRGSDDASVVVGSPSSR